jgi:hypothetical protein
MGCNWMPLMSPFTSHYLLFEHQPEEDDGVISLEAMASVRLADWPRLQAEVVAVLDGLTTHLHTPAMPLDDGGAWDAWLQVQIDEAASTSLEASAPTFMQWHPSADAAWIAVTLTLAIHQLYWPKVASAFALLE